MLYATRSDNLTFSFQLPTTKAYRVFHRSRSAGINSITTITLITAWKSRTYLKNDPLFYYKYYWLLGHQLCTVTIPKFFKEQYILL